MCGRVVPTGEQTEVLLFSHHDFERICVYRIWRGGALGALFLRERLTGGETKESEKSRLTHGVLLHLSVSPPTLPACFFSFRGLVGLKRH